MIMLVTGYECEQAAPFKWIMKLTARATYIQIYAAQVVLCRWECEGRARTLSRTYSGADVGDARS